MNKNIQQSDVLCCSSLSFLSSIPFLYISHFLLSLWLSCALDVSEAHCIWEGMRGIETERNTTFFRGSFIIAGNREYNKKTTLMRKRIHSRYCARLFLLDHAYESEECSLLCVLICEWKQRTLANIILRYEIVIIVKNYWHLILNKLTGD